MLFIIISTMAFSCFELIRLVEELPSVGLIAIIFYTRIKKVPNFLATNIYNLENKG